MTCSDPSSREIDDDLDDCRSGSVSVNIESMLNAVANDLSIRDDETNAIFAEQTSIADLAELRARDTLTVLTGLREKLDVAFKRNPSDSEEKEREERRKKACMRKRLGELDTLQSEVRFDEVRTVYAAELLVTESTDYAISRDEEESKRLDRSREADLSDRPRKSRTVGALPVEEEPAAQHFLRSPRKAPLNTKRFISGNRNKWIPSRLLSTRKLFAQNDASAAGPSGNESPRGDRGREAPGSSSRAPGVGSVNVRRPDMNRLSTSSKVLRLLSFKSMTETPKGSPISPSSPANQSSPEDASRNATYKPFRQTTISPR
jgi:hypothetical protein